MIPMFVRVQLWGATAPPVNQSTGDQHSSGIERRNCVCDPLQVAHRDPLHWRGEVLEQSKAVGEHRDTRKPWQR